jgi:hypothetical protein
MEERRERLRAACSLVTGALSAHWRRERKGGGETRGEVVVLAHGIERVEEWR